MDARVVAEEADGPLALGISDRMGGMVEES